MVVGLTASPVVATAQFDAGLNRTNIGRVPERVPASAAHSVPDPRISWRMSDPFLLPAVSVSVGGNSINPVYYVRLPDGSLVDVPPLRPVDLSGLSRSEIATATEDTRAMLESFTRLLLAGKNPGYAVVQENYATVMSLNLKDYPNIKGRAFDPIASVLEDHPLGAQDVEFVVNPEKIQRAAKDALVDGVWPPEHGEQGASRAMKATSSPNARLRQLLSFVRDAIYTSTIDAAKQFLKTRRSLKNQIQEYGFQFGLRAEFQVGAGGVNITRNYPVNFSIGYNRVTRTFVFRRGFRVEKMSGGTALSLGGGKVEFRVYRLSADTANAADPRANYAKVTGQSWYPPSIPIFSPLADSAPGYRSEGFALGFSIQNLFLPQTILLDVPFALMNTVISFEETQKVYTSKQIPDPALLLKRVQNQINQSVMKIGGSSRARLALQCQALFVD